MNLSRSLFLLLCALIISGQSFANSIDKGYEALYKFDYFKAKKYFTKGLKYHTGPAAQGLAIIYYRQDNPFHSFDSALVYIQMSHTKWFVTKERRKVLYQKYGFTEDSITSLRQLVSSEFYADAVATGQVTPLTDFIKDHSWAKEVDRAVEIRDSLAFFNVVNSNQSFGFKAYTESYPNSQYASLAVENYHNLLFEETTQANDLASYVEFVTLYPDNPNLKEAENKIYEIVTYPNTTEAFEVFIEKYPENSFVQSSWKELFQSYLSEDYSREYIDQFLVKYPNYPYPEDIVRELSLIDSVFLPWQKDELFGFIGTNGEIYAQPIYNSVSFFSEGLSAVEIDGKYGYITKTGELLIPCQFDAASEFHDGRAIVECADKMGMIDRNGRFILPCEFDDVGPVTDDDIFYASKDDKYGYFGFYGKNRIPMMYEDAFDFNQGRAKVEFEGKQGYIDIYGSFVVPPAYEKISPFFDTLYTFEDDGLVGLMNHKCQIFLEPKFSVIGQLSEGLAVAILAETEELVYIDTIGNIRIQGGFEVFPNYLLLGEFHGNTAVVMMEGKYGRIDHTGKLKTPVKYQNIGQGASFYPFEKDGLWGLMNNLNEVVIPHSYESVELIGDNYLIVSKHDTLGMTSCAGNFLLPLSFKSITPLKEDLFIVDDWKGLALYKGNKILTKHVYKQVGLYHEDFVFLVEEDRIVYYDLKNSKIIEAIDE